MYRFDPEKETGKKFKEPKANVYGIKHSCKDKKVWKEIMDYLAED